MWDKIKRPAKDFWPETWKKSHALATAFKHSAVWYYQELVPRITSAQYQTWLARFKYGNQTFTAGSDQFWLNTELKISPQEQVNFIVCLLKARCGVSKKTVVVFETAALQETKNDVALYAKTGAGSIDLSNSDGAFEGFFWGSNKRAVNFYLQPFSMSAIPTKFNPNTT